VKFEKLVEQGIIQAHRDEELRWRVSKGSVLNYIKQSQPANNARLIIENHYEEVIERICEAKSSIKIMTGDFKRFKLKPTAKQGKNYNDGTPFIKYLMEMTNQGISVQIICSNPSKPFKEEYEELDEQMNPKNFRIYFCIRNHAKVVIVDNKVAYIGSANITKAGLGQGIMSPGNFEMGILTENPDIIASLNARFSEIMDGDFCEGCHRADNCVEY
jgi:phosphatidylserine/phosphatidylglycerophosphate/cardiolipin synthase-like enzyme